MTALIGAVIASRQARHGPAFQIFLSYMQCREARTDIIETE